MNRAHWKCGSLTSVHLESRSSKLAHQKSGSLKSVHWKPRSEQCPFTKSFICGWPAREHYVAPGVTWSLQISKNLLVWITFFFPLSAPLLHSRQFGMCSYLVLLLYAAVLTRITRISNPPKLYSKMYGLTWNSGCPWYMWSVWKVSYRRRIGGGYAIVANMVPGNSMCVEWTDPSFAGLPVLKSTVQWCIPVTCNTNATKTSAASLEKCRNCKRSTWKHSTYRRTWYLHHTVLEMSCCARMIQEMVSLVIWKMCWVSQVTTSTEGRSCTTLHRAFH
jgi:hypothetical protein